MLFAFESPRREATARRALTGATVAVATAVLGDGSRPSNDVWLPTGASPAVRVRLASLARVPFPAGALSRIEGGRSWRYSAFYGDDEASFAAEAVAGAWVDEDQDGEAW